MNKREFFLKGLRAGACKKRPWVMSLFTVIIQDAPRESMPDYPYRTFFNEQGMCFIDPENNNELTYIDDYVKGESLFDFLEPFTLQPGDLDNYPGPGPLLTSAGNVYVNQLLLCIPFRDKIGYMNGRIDLKSINEQILGMLVDDPNIDDLTPDPLPGTDEFYAPWDQIYIWQYLLYSEYSLSIVGLAAASVTSITPRSLTGHPDRYARIQEMIDKAEPGQLSDPAYIAKIGKLAEELDHEWLKDDPSYQFYMAKKSKMFGNVRKRLMYFFGGESPFEDGTQVEFIQQPLVKGIDTNFLPVMNNSLRYGSYSRGSQTQLGGEATKTMYRMMGGARITEQDCGTPVGIPYILTQQDRKLWIGFAYVVKPGQPEFEMITTENVDSLVGKPIQIRGPMTCKTGRNTDEGIAGKGKNICAVCAGAALAEQPNGLAAAVAALGGRFLTLFMKKMHGTVLKTAKWDFRKHIH